MEFRKTMKFYETAKIACAQSWWILMKFLPLESPAFLPENRSCCFWHTAVALSLLLASLLSLIPCCYGHPAVDGSLLMLLASLLCYLPVVSGVSVVACSVLLLVSLLLLIPYCLVSLL
jgi:hypothetical protein